MTSPDVGFYLKWSFDDQGFPIGCGVFDKVKPHANWYFNKFEKIGYADCPKQDLRENGDSGKMMWEKVEDFADNQEEWLETFAMSFKKMMANGYGISDLEQGPESFWAFDCKCRTTEYRVEH